MVPLCLVIAVDAGPAWGFRRQFDFTGFKTYAVATFEAALGLLRQWRFDAVLVDGDGYEGSLMEALTELGDQSSAPLGLLCSDGNEQRRLEALRRGVSEVFVKPIAASLIASKLRRHFASSQRRTGADAHDRQPMVTLGPLRLDPRRATARIGDTPIAFTPGESGLLLLLASQAGQFVHRDTIARTLGFGLDSGGRSTDMHVYRIRRKLRSAGAQGLRIDTLHAWGYCLSVAESRVTMLPAEAPAVTVRLRDPHVPAAGSRRRPHARAIRLIARLYTASNLTLRARLLACLVRPLGALSLMSIAEGAFGGLLHRSSDGRIRIVIDDVVRFSGRQIAELASFVEQVNPQTLQHFAGTLSDGSSRIAAFSASATLLLLRELARAAPHAGG